MIGMNSQDSYPGIQGAYITLLKGSPRQSDSHAMVWLLERNIWCGIILEKAPHLQQWNFWHMSLVGYVCLGSILSLANVYLRDLHSEDHKGSSSGTSFSRGETAWDNLSQLEGILYWCTIPRAPFSFSDTYLSSRKGHSDTLTHSEMILTRTFLTEDTL